jgi:hypothetical protein
VETSSLRIWDSANPSHPFSAAVSAFGVRVVLWSSRGAETALFLLDPCADGRSLVVLAHGPRSAEAERLWLSFATCSAVPRHPREAVEAFVAWRSSLSSACARQ